MPWSKSTRIQRPRAWAVTGPYRELMRRLPRCGGSRRRLLALAGRRATGMGKLGATREGVVAAFAGWLLARSSPEASTLHGQEVADLSVSAYSQPVT
jgi:hypothetical protein